LPRSKRTTTKLKMHDARTHASPRSHFLSSSASVRLRLGASARSSNKKKPHSASAWRAVCRSASSSTLMRSSARSSAPPAPRRSTS
ncbi:MAG: hypothetical protein ACK56I_04975, partial [bacterium]